MLSKPVTLQGKVLILELKWTVEKRVPGSLFFGVGDEEPPSYNMGLKKTQRSRRKTNLCMSCDTVDGSEIPNTQPPVTLPETNIAPKNGWLEYHFPIGEAYFQGPC